MPKNKIIIILVALVAFQMVFSFVYPVFEPGNSCQHSADYFLNTNAPKMHNQLGVNQKEFGLADKFFQWFPNYHMICDSTSFLLLAKDWPQSYHQRNIYIDHPLYNFFAELIIGPLSWFIGTPSYPVIFGVFMVVNFFLAAVATILFYLLIYEYISPKVAFLSAVFFVFSPFTHAMINQPTSSGMMEVFVVSAGIWLIWSYIKNPSNKKLVINSLLFGLLLLGKQIFALSLFALLLAWHFNRKKEGAIFFVLQFVPTFLWFLYVKFGLQLSYYLVNISNYDQGTWFLKAHYWQPSVMGTILLTALPKLFTSTIYGFILLPVIFSIYGLYALEKKYKYLIYFGFVVSFFLLFFGMNYWRGFLSFLMFPVIYPTAAIGIQKIAEYLKKYGVVLPRLFYWGIIVLIIIISNLNIYLFVPTSI